MGWGVGGEKGVGFLTPLLSLLRRRRWSVSLALALVALCAVTIVGAAESAKDARDARQAVWLSAAYQDAESALDAEHTAVERLRS